MQKQSTVLPFGFGWVSVKVFEAFALRPDSNETEALPGQLLRHHMKFQLGELD